MSYHFYGDTMGTDPIEKFFSPRSRRNLNAHLLRTKFGEKIHLERVRELRRRTEGEVHVLAQHFRDVRTRDLHALGKLRLRNAQLLHATEDAAEEGGGDMVNCGQGELAKGI